MGILDWCTHAEHAGRIESSSIIFARFLLLVGLGVASFTDPTNHQSQRDLYVAMRDLFVRHERLSVDQVDRLKKRVDSNALKLESIKAVAKDGWEEEADKVAGTIEKDKATITAQLNRRVFIRAWYASLSISSARKELNYWLGLACGTSCAWCCTTERLHFSHKSCRRSPARSKSTRMRWRRIGDPWWKRWRICLLNERRIANMAIALRSAFDDHNVL